MKASTLLLSAGLALTSAGVCSAQVITTFETLTAWGLSNATSSFSNGTALVQTFQLPVATPAIYSMSWHFVTPSNSSVTGESSLEAYITEWNTATNRPTGAAIWSDLTASLPAYDTGSYDLTLTPNLLTDPNTTYAMILRGVSVAANVQIANADADDGFSYGQNFRRSSGATSFATLSTLPYQAPGEDWGFSQISISDSVLTPIPEAGSVAIAFSGALVAGLALRRRRKADAAPAADMIAAA